MITDAITDDGYLHDDLEEIRASLLPEIDATPADMERVLAARAVARAGRRRGPQSRRMHRAAAAAARSATRRDATPPCAIALRTSRTWWPASSWRCCAASCAAAKTNSKWRWRWCAPAIRAREPRSIPARPSTSIPDVFVRRTEHGWVVEINQSTVPRVRVNQGYANLVSRSADHAMLRTQLQEARWLMRSLEIRNETLVKVARCIVQRQTGFFEHGEEAMEPLILKDVAEAVEMHESTISRVTTAQIHAHPARRVRIPLFLFQPRRARPTARRCPRRPSAPRSAS